MKINLGKIRKNTRYNYTPRYYKGKDTGNVYDFDSKFNKYREATNAIDFAADMRTNSFTTPRFLLKAAITAINTGDADAAEEYLMKIEEEYADSPEADKVAVYLGQARAMKK